jgi:hypothetical protein
VPNQIYEGALRSMCLDCLVELRRFELQNVQQIMQRILPDNVREALHRLKDTDAKQLADPVKEAQFQHDIQTIKGILPY